MSKIFKKENIMPVVVLTAICLLIAAVLGVVNMFTKDIIEENETQKVYDSLRVVIDGKFEPIAKPEGAPKSVVDVYKVTDGGELVGHAVTLSVQGYASVISITVGVDKDGNVTKAVVTSQAESHGKAGMANYTDNFAGVSKDDVANVDTFSGATVSSTAIKNAIIDAVNTVTGSLPEEPVEEPLPREESEVIALAKTLVGTEVELTNVTPDGLTYARRIYKAGSEGYVAYVVVMSRYGYPETETLVHVGNDAKIKNVNKIVWKPSDPNPQYGYNPPSEEVVDAFYQNLVGKNSADLKAYEKTDDKNDFTSGATSTSTNLRDALVEALEGIEVLIKKDMPRPEEDVKALAIELVGKDVTLENVTPEENEYVKRIYKTENDGYVAYVVVMSRYGYPETETLVHVGKDAKIKNINKMVWKPSDANPDLSYNPPSEEVVDAFYQNLIGKNADDLKAYEKTDDKNDFTSGATSTSTNLRDALVEAMEDIEVLIAKDMPTPEDELKTLINALLGKEVELKNVTPADSTYVKRIYKTDSDGYVAYVVVMSRYGYPETETLVHVGNDGKIKNVNKMVWKPSDANPDLSYNPPSEEVVNAFYQNLIGKSSADLKAYEKTDSKNDFTSGATSTSTNLRDALVEAMDEIEVLIRNDMPTEESRVKELAEKLIGKDVDLEDVTPKNLEYVRRIYSAGKEGYIVYAVVISKNYGTVETETLIHVGRDGKIKGIDKLTWKTSDAIYGYVPPTEEVVNAFYDKLIGKNAAAISAFEGADLVSNATNTSTNLKTAIVEGLEAVEEIRASVPNYTARIVGIVILVLAALGVAAYKFVPIIIKRRKNG